jgi:hypothetical protein
MGLFDGVMSERERLKLLLTGLPAQATVTGIKSLGKTSEAGVLTEITLQVDPPGVKPFARTIREWLPPGVDTGLSIGSVVSVRHRGKAMVLEATDGTRPAGSGASWVPPPVQPAGGWVQGPAQVSGSTFVLPPTVVSGLMDAEAIAGVFREAMERMPGLTGASFPTLSDEAPATVVEVSDISQDSGYLIASIRLRVEPPGQPPLERTTTVHFSTPERRAMVTPGRTLQVRYDPANPAAVLILPHSLT